MTKPWDFKHILASPVAQPVTQPAAEPPTATTVQGGPVPPKNAGLARTSPRNAAPNGASTTAAAVSVPSNTRMRGRVTEIGGDVLRAALKRLPPEWQPADIADATSQTVRDHVNARMDGPSIRLLLVHLLTEEEPGAIYKAISDIFKVEPNYIGRWLSRTPIGPDGSSISTGGKRKRAAEAPPIAESPAQHARPSDDVGPASVSTMPLTTLTFVENDKLRTILRGFPANLEIKGIDSLTTQNLAAYVEGHIYAHGIRMALMSWCNEDYERLSVPLVSALTGAPARTLRRWRSQMGDGAGRPKAGEIPLPDLPPPPSAPPFEVMTFRAVSRSVDMSSGFTARAAGALGTRTTMRPAFLQAASMSIPQGTSSASIPTLPHKFASFDRAWQAGERFFMKGDLYVADRHVPLNTTWEGAQFRLV